MQCSVVQSMGTVADLGNTRGCRCWHKSIVQRFGYSESARMALPLLLVALIGRNRFVTKTNPIPTLQLLPILSRLAMAPVHETVTFGGFSAFGRPERNLPYI